MFIPFKILSANIVADAFISWYVAFLAILSDQGRQLTSSVFKELCDSLQITYDFTSKDSNSSNHKERAFGVLGKMFRTLSEREQSPGQVIFPSCS